MKRLLAACLFALLTILRLYWLRKELLMRLDIISELWDMSELWEPYVCH